MSAMLHVDPKKRPTALQLCKHPWFSNIDSLPNIKLSNIQDYNLVRVCYFVERKKTKFIHLISFLKHNLDVTFNAINANSNKTLSLGPIGDSNLFKRRNERTVHQQKFEIVK